MHRRPACPPIWPNYSAAPIKPIPKRPMSCSRHFTASYTVSPSVSSNEMVAASGVVFPAQVVDEVTEFMKALTDPAARNLQSIVPNRVPSRIPVDGARGGPGRED